MPDQHDIDRVTGLDGFLANRFNGQSVTDTPSGAASPGFAQANPRRPPQWFAAVRDEARDRWDQLEQDEDLAGPWRLLFEQVQSPRHVLSELLQNADDVGARRARAAIVDDRFIFEHDGRDFEEEEFRSLCRFAFSNKRKLHTIGFRGVGFKSTFSLGHAVEVLTPTLAVRFHSARFTEPEWLDDAPPCSCTRVAVQIEDADRRRELAKNLREWVESPASLLFFSHLTELTVGEVTLGRTPLGPGPVPRSEKVRLRGRSDVDVLVIRSDEQPFPDEAVEEIRRERRVTGEDLPACDVELVLGLPGPNRIYVVLPTATSLATPFSCNAPFLQDPARTGIKDLSLSPTNRWLLERLGRLAAKAMSEWLGNPELDLTTRAEAYGLLPERPREHDTTSGAATSALCRGFAEAVDEDRLLLGTSGQLVRPGDCVAPPVPSYGIWCPDELLAIFGDGAYEVLSELVSRTSRDRLESWGWLRPLDDDDLIERLGDGRPVPRPKSHERLLALWDFVQEATGYDWGGKRRRELAIVPVEGGGGLLAANDVVRLPERREGVSDESWSFLVSLVRVVDRGWLQFLTQVGPEDAAAEAARELRRVLNLDRTSDLNTVMSVAYRGLLLRPGVTLAERVRIAQLMAALSARAPEGVRWITRDGVERGPDEGIVATLDPSVESLLPAPYAAKHLLDDAYFIMDGTCSMGQWVDWLQTPDSGLLPFAPIREKRHEIWGDVKLADVLAERNARPPQRCYVTMEYRLIDWDFDKEVVDHWSQAAGTPNAAWSQVTECILKGPAFFWEGRVRATVSQVATTGTERVLEGDFIPAAWIMRLRTLECLLDTYGRVRLPADLYVRTPETEPLLSVEPFVRADLDSEATKPLLRLLGVRDSPAGLGGLVDRIRAIAKAPDASSLVAEIVRWYGALDAALLHCEPAELAAAREAFAMEPLILTASGEWAKSGEVFQLPGDMDATDNSLVHPAVNDLTMWTRLGVALRPSAEAVLTWLKGLPSGRPLAEGTSGRLRSALQSYAAQVWESCRHWLSLDGVWTPVDQFRFRLTMQSLTRWSRLFLTVKAVTADLQMLSSAAVAAPPFAPLRDLADCLEYRFSRGPRSGATRIDKPWLAALSCALATVQTGDAESTRRVRAAANRLSRSVWYSFDKNDLVEVTPYVDGVPAGQPETRDVLWFDTSIFVRDGGLAKSFDALVDELARPFQSNEVTEAIKACVERDEAFVGEYVHAHFTLESETRPERGSGGEQPENEVWRPAVGGAGAQGQRADEGAPEPALDGAGGAVTDLAGETATREVSEDEEPAETEGCVPVGTAREESAEAESHVRVDTATEDDERPKPAGRQVLCERLACGLGFERDRLGDGFTSRDGSCIERCEKESPMQWRRVDPSGNLVAEYWVSSGSLDKAGLVIPSEVWAHLERSECPCYVVLEGAGGEPLLIAGRELARMAESGAIELYPASYRLRAVGGT